MTWFGSGSEQKMLVGQKHYNIKIRTKYGQQEKSTNWLLRCWQENLINPQQ